MRHKQTWKYMICEEREDDTDRNKGSSKKAKYSKKKKHVSWNYPKDLTEKLIQD